MKEVKGFELNRILGIRSNCTVFLKANAFYQGQEIKVKLASRRTFTAGRVGNEKIELIILDYLADKIYIEEVPEIDGKYDICPILKAHNIETQVSDIQRWKYFRKYSRPSDLSLGSHGVVTFNSYWMDGYVHTVSADCIGAEDILPGVQITYFFYETDGSISKSMRSFVELLVGKKYSLATLEKTLRDNEADVWGKNISISTNKMNMSKTYNNIRFKYNDKEYKFTFDEIENSIDLFIDAMKAQSKGDLEGFFESII